MKKTTGNLPFEQQSAGKLLLTMCLPAVIIMVVMTVYHMTDLFFIGQLGDVTQLAAVSLVSPAIGIQSVFGTLIGGGGCAIIARRLGEKKGGEREIAGSCLLLSLASGGLYAAVLLAGIGQLLPLLGVSEQAAPFARQYLTIAAISTPAVVFSTAFGNIIRAEGAARQSMTANLLGTLTNILLDPLFILVFGMGVTGAALATALGNLLSALYLVRYLRSAKSRLAPTLTKHGCWTSLIPILTLGLPSALGNLLMNLAGGIQNRMLTGYGVPAVRPATEKSATGFNPAGDCNCNKTAVFRPQRLCLYPNGGKIKKTDGFSICPQRKTSHPFHPRSFHRIGQAGPPVIWTC